MALVDAFIGAIVSIGFSILANTPGELIATNNLVRLAKAPQAMMLGEDGQGDLNRGTIAPTVFLNSGNDNEFLAGPNGDLVNAGPGVNTEIFIPEDDAGTTIIVSPGSATIVGGNPRDQLVLPVDRLWTSENGVPTSESTSDVSSTLKLVGGPRLSTEVVTGSGARDRDAKKIWYGSELTKYGTSITYSSVGDGDLQIDIAAAGPPRDSLELSATMPDPAAPQPLKLWTARLLLKNFHPGDFGLSFSTRASISKPKSDSAQVAEDDEPYSPSPESAEYINDNGSIQWNGKFASNESRGPAPLPNPSQAKLNADLKALENLYRDVPSTTPSAPFAREISAETDQHTSITLPLAIDSNESFSIAIVEAPSKARVTLNPDDTLTFDPEGAFSSLEIGARETVTFIYQVTDVSTKMKSNVATVTITIVNGPTDEATVADFLAGTAPVNWAIGGSLIADTAANVAANIDALERHGQIARIRLIDIGTPTLTLTAAQAASDRDVLYTITNTKYAVSVSDTAAHVATELHYLNAVRRLASISLIDSGMPTLFLTAKKTLDDKTALSKITNPTYAIAVEDRSSDIASNLTALAANDHVTSISGVFGFHLNLTVDQTLANMKLLTSGETKVDIVDTAANIVANYAALAPSSLVTSVSVNDTVGNILANLAALERGSRGVVITATDTVANILPETAALKDHVPQIVVVDTAANVVDKTKALSEMAPPPMIKIVDAVANVAKTIDALDRNHLVGAIKLTDGGEPVLTLSVKQALSDRKAIHDIENARFDIVISDSAANVSTNFDFLNRDNQIVSIVLNDPGAPKLKLKAVQTLGDTYFRRDAFEKIKNSNYAVSVDDTERAVAEHISRLGNIAKISAIVLTDGARLTLPAYEALSNIRTFDKISNGGFAITIADTALGVLETAKALSANKYVKSIAVTDSAARIVANYAALRANRLVTSIAVDDGIENILDNRNALVNKVNAIHVRDTSAAVLGNTNGLRGLPALKSVMVDDTADEDARENLGSHLDALNADVMITSIRMFGRPLLNLTAEQAAKDSRAFAKMTDAPNILVRDTAANVIANLEGLSANASISSIETKDFGEFALTAQQALSSRKALEKLVNSNVRIIVRDSASSILKNYRALLSAGWWYRRISVTDNVSNVMANFSAIREHLTPLFSITAVDSAAQILANQAALTDDGASVKIVDSAANLEKNSEALNKLKPPASVAVVDTAANVAARFDVLKNNPRISAIFLTDPATPVLKLSEQQIADGAATINEITNAKLILGVTDPRSQAVNAFVVRGAAGDLVRIWRIYMISEANNSGSGSTF